MPPRKAVLSLQQLCLTRIGDLFQSSIRRLADQVLLGQRDDPCCAGSGSVRWSRQHEAIGQMQQCFFVQTAHLFYAQIATECIIAMSELHKATLAQHRTEDASRDEQLLQWQREQWQLDFLQVLCHPAVRQIDISHEALGRRFDLHWAVVCRLCSLLIFMPAIQTLNLGQWSCKRFGLLSDHNQNEGWPLRFLPDLRHICVYDVSERFFQNVGLHCPRLRCLQVYSSDITDQAVSWISRCHHLERIELIHNRHVTPIGFSQLLRSNPHLRTVGRCDCLAQVLSLLYDPTSVFRRTVPSIPEHLCLEDVNSNEKMSAVHLQFLVRFCPNLRRIRINYLPDAVYTDPASFSRRFGRQRLPPDAWEDEPELHLARLCCLDKMEQLSIASADFFGHLLFRVLEVRGDQITLLDLVHVDELNLNAVLLIGAKCHQLRSLSLQGCHFQLQPDDPITVNSLCRRLDGHVIEADSAAEAGGWLGSAGLMERRRHWGATGFGQLNSLNVFLNSPTHLPIVQYILWQAQALQKLTLNQFFIDFDESFVTHTLFQWNPMVQLRELDISRASKLSIVAVNVILENCPRLQRLSWVSHWGRVLPEQLAAIRREVQLRNLDLVIDGVQPPDMSPQPPDRL